MRLKHTRLADLNLLVALAVLLEERQISSAAERYFLSQPAMSRTLQRLRALFRDELLVRTKEGYELTLRAKQIQGKLTEILTSLELMLQGTDFDPSIAEDSFTIACTDYAAIILGEFLFESFYHQAPHASLKIESWYDDAFRDCDRGKLDLVLWVNAVPQPLVSEILFEEEFVCVVSQNNPIGEEALTLQKFLDCYHVVVNVEKGQQTLIERKLEELGVTRKPALQVPYFSAAIYAVARTSLIATVPKRIARHYCNKLNIKILQAPIELKSFRYIMAWHPRLSEDKAHCWLRNLIKRCAISI